MEQLTENYPNSSTLEGACASAVSGLRDSLEGNLRFFGDYKGVINASISRQILRSRNHINRSFGQRRYELAQVDDYVDRLKNEDRQVKRFIEFSRKIEWERAEFEFLTKEVEGEVEDPFVQRLFEETQANLEWLTFQPEFDSELKSGEKTLNDRKLRLVRRLASSKPKVPESEQPDDALDEAGSDTQSFGREFNWGGRTITMHGIAKIRMFEQIPFVDSDHFPTKAEITEQVKQADYMGMPSDGTISNYLSSSYICRMLMEGNFVLDFIKDENGQRRFFINLLENVYYRSGQGEELSLKPEGHLSPILTTDRREDKKKDKVSLKPKIELPDELRELLEPINPVQIVGNSELYRLVENLGRDNPEPKVVIEKSLLKSGNKDVSREVLLTHEAEEAENYLTPDDIQDVARQLSLMLPESSLDGHMGLVVRVASGTICRSPLPRTIDITRGLSSGGDELVCSFFESSGAYLIRKYIRETYGGSNDRMSEDIMGGLAGLVFEELSYIYLHSQLKENERLLSPQETLELMGLRNPDKNMVCHPETPFFAYIQGVVMPDGLRLSKDGDQWYMNGVCEYKISKDLEKDWKQIEVLRRPRYMVRALNVRTVIDRMSLGRDLASIKKGSFGAVRISSHPEFIYATTDENAEDPPLPEITKLPITRTEFGRVLNAFIDDSFRLGY